MPFGGFLSGGTGGFGIPSTGTGGFSIPGLTPSQSGWVSYFNALANSLKGNTGGTESNPGGNNPLNNPNLPLNLGDPNIWVNLLGALFGGQGGNSALGGSATNALLNELMQGLGLGFGIYGGFQASGQQGFDNSNKTNILNNLFNLQGGAANTLSAINGAVSPGLVNYANAEAPASLYNQNDILNKLGYLYNTVPDAYHNILSANEIPGMSGVFNQIGGELGQGNYGMGVANSIAGGQNPLTQIAQGVGANTLLSGGYTPQLNTVTGIGQSLTQPNPYVTQVQNRAAQLLSQNPLLPMDQVLSMARNQNATDSMNQFNALKRNLANQTGITGPAIAGGGENEFLSEFGDQALQSQAQAMTNALMGQQNLQLNQFGQGANLFNSGMQGALGSSGQGLNAILQAAAQAQGNMQGLGALGISGINTQLGGLGALSSLLGSTGGLTQQDISALLNAANLGLNQTQGMYGTIGNLLGQQGNIANLQQQGYLGASNQSTAFMNTLADYMKSIANSQVGLFGNAGNQTTNLFQGLK